MTPHNTTLHNNRIHELHWIEQLLGRVQSIEGKLSGVEELLSALLDRLEQRHCHKRFWTTEEVAELMDVSPFTVRTHWIGKGRLPAQKTESGRWLIPDEAVQSLKRGEPLDPPTH